MRFLGILAVLALPIFALKESLVMVQQHNKQYCITDETDKAVVWNTPLDKDYGNVSVGYNGIKYWELPADWDKRMATKQHFGLVLDSRWESFPTAVSYTAKYAEKLIFTELMKITAFKSFEIPISLRAEKETHLYICEDFYKNPTETTCVWFMLGAWQGQASALRKCKSGEIPTWNGIPTGNCKENLDQINKNPLKSNSYIHFIVKFDSNDKSISLRILGERKPFLRYVDDNYDSSIQYRKIWANSRDGNAAFWKIHEYNFYIMRTFGTQWTDVLSTEYYSKEVCISMYATVFNGYSITLFLSTQHSVVKQETYAFNDNVNWQKISMSYVGTGNSYYLRVRVESSTNAFIALDRVHVNDCSQRGLKLSVLSASEEASCQYLLEKDEKIEPHPPTDPTKLDLECPLGTIGPSCISCYVSFGIYRNICEKSKICQYKNDREVCYCGSGYWGNSCEKSCPSGTYGLNCNEKCGKCYSLCNSVDGACSSCLDNFSGTYCNETIFPIVKEAPKLIGDCFTECEFSVNALNYKGRYPPTQYTIYYKEEQDPEWIRIDGTFDVSKKTFVMNNLQVSQRYSVKIVLFSADGNFYSNDEIPVLSFTTKCRDIQKDDISVDPTDRTVLFKNLDVKRELCEYTLELTYDGRVIYSKKLEVNNVVQNLEPDTQYTYAIKNKERTELSEKFITKEAAPDEVTQVNFSSTSNEITVSWDLPKFPNGKILGYNIVLKHLRYISCTKDTSDLSLIRDVNVSKTEHTFGNLHPYSIYRFSIRAMNSIIGKEYNLDADTKELDKLTPEAYALNVEQQKEITMNYRYNCMLVYSTFVITVNLTCQEEFSKCPIQLWINDSKPIRMQQLKPFVEYTIQPKVLNNFGSTIELEKSVFKTNPGKPNDIINFELYDLDDSSMSFKFLPPYPPTGEIEKYQMKITLYKSGRRNSVIYDNQINAIPCEVWNWMICVKTPKKLTLTNYYYIELKVKNKNVGTWSTPSKYEGYLLYDAPGQPLSVTGTWDDGYNLTVFWQHPDKSNGVLTRFIISDGVAPYDYIVEKYNLTYNYTIQMEQTDKPETAISISSVNKVAASGYTTWRIFNPPPRPRFNVAPKITEITNTTININIPPVEYLIGISNMYIIILKDKERSDPEISARQTGLIREWIDVPERKTAWISLFVNLSPGQTNAALIGTNFSTHMERIEEDIQNRVLPYDTKFEIYFVASNIRNKLERFDTYWIQSSTGPGGNAAADDGVNYLIYASVLFLLVPIIALIIYARKNKISFIKLSELRNDRHSARRPLANNDTIPLTNTSDSASQITEEPQAPSGYSRIVNLSDFEEYVKESVFNGELARQHSLFPRGEQKPNDYGKLPQNKSKNRYMNLVAYNHSRVKLKKLPGDQFSDYINATYIKGLKSPRAYIATQGPKPNTVNDFWRMVWEENVANIAMLANVIENGKKKTEQYWPNYNEEIDFAEINVRHVSTEIFADYEIRSFLIKSNGEERKVQQMHFNTWPDHGVPLYPQTLVPFVRRILTFPHDSKPIVIHCSAGVGRTGTIILIDLALRMAAKMGYVDILSILHQIREQRANMVDNIEQYKLAHLVILECLFSPDTAISCNESFEEAMRKTIERDLHTQMDYIEKSAWQENAISMSKDVKVKNQPEKDRFPGVNVESYGVIYLPPYPSTDEASTYVNAAAVDGFRSRKRFIATQNPLPKTVGDFWRVAVDNDVDIIVSLQEIDGEDPTCCQFIPSKEQKVINVNPIISIHHVQTEHLDTCEIVSVSLHHKEEPKKIKIVVLKGWRFGDHCPANRNALLAAWQQMNNLSWNENRVIVTCRDGISACGLYLAMAFTLEKIKLEQVCDVCHAVRVIRRSRRQFVQSQEQFIALYEIVFLYLSEFELYANFSKKQ